MIPPSYHFSILKGNDVEQYIQDIATLRLTIFAEPPYCYQGTREIEIEYLKTYQKNSNSLLIIAKFKETVIGAITGVPFQDTPDTYQTPISNNGFNISECYYLGDIIVLKEYRSRAIGDRLYRLFERTLREQGHYKYLVARKVVVSDQDPRRRGSDAFWIKQGFELRPDLTSIDQWPEEKGGIHMDHTMSYLVKKL